MTSGYNINIVKGDTFQLDITVTNNSGTPIDLTLYSGAASLRRKQSSQNNLGDLSLSFLSGVSGGMRLSMDATGTAALPVTQAVYDVDIYDSLSTATTILWGYANIFPEGATSSTGSTTVVLGGGGGSSAVDSVAGKIGNVVLYVADINGLTEYLATGVSGVSQTVLNATGQFLLGEINDINLVSGDFVNQFYPRTQNPAGYLTTLAPTGQLTGAFYPLSSNPAGYLLSSDLTPFATISYVTGVSGILRQNITLLNNWTGSTTGLYYPLIGNPAGFLTSLSATGQLTGEFYPLLSNPLNYITSSQTGAFASDSDLAIATGALTGAFYPRTDNPAGYLISSDLSSYATVSYVNGVSGALDARLIVISNWTGSTTGLYYPYSSNPAGYITSLSATGQLTGQFVSHSQTGDFVSNAELLATSGALEDLISASSAGVAAINGQSGVVNISVTGNLSLSANEGTILISGNTGDLANVFYPLSANPAGYLTNLNATGQLTGEFYPLNTNPLNYITSSQTGVFASDIELANATGQLTGAFYPRFSNPLNYLTSADLSAYATIDFVTGVSGNLSSSITTIQAWTGSTTGLYYPLSSNPLNYITSSQTGAFASDIELSNATGLLTGAFYPRFSNPSSYLVAADLSSYATQSYVTGASGVLRADILILQNWTGSTTGLYYPLSSNPSNYITSAQTGVFASDIELANATGNLTGAFYPLLNNPAGYLTSSSLSSYATIDYVTGVSGVLRTDLNSLINWTGSTTGLYYPLSSNPAGYLTTLSPTGQLTGEFVRRSESGAFASDAELLSASGYLQSLISASSAGVSTLNGLSGVLNLTGAGNVTITTGAGTITISGNTGSLVNSFYPLSDNPSGYVRSTSGTVTVQGGGTILDGQLLIGASGINGFEQGNLYGLTGITIVSGSGSLGIGINSLVLTGIVAGTNITVQNNNNGTFTVNSTASGGSGSSTPFAWTRVTGATTITMNSGYLTSGVSGGGRVNLTLPTSATLGSYFKTASINASGFQISQNSGQIIYFGDVSSTAGTGGYLQSTATRDSLEIVCIGTDREFQVVSSVGNLFLL
jgi:hypothetical protein